MAALKRRLQDAGPSDALHLLAALPATQLPTTAASAAVAEAAFESLQPVAAQLSAAEAASLLAAAAEPGAPQLPPALLRQALEASELKLAAAPLAAALALLDLQLQLRVAPTDAWLQAFYRRISASLAGAGATAGSAHGGVPGSVEAYDAAIVCMLSGSGLAASCEQPAGGWNSAAASLPAPGTLPDEKLSGAAAVAVLIDLARARAQPLPGWVAAVASAALLRNDSGDASLPYLEGPALADFCWALDCLAHAPAPALEAAVLAACRQQGSGLAVPRWASLLRSLSRLGARPDDSWLAACLAALQPRLAGCSVKDLAGVAAGLAALGAAPSPVWLTAACNASLPLLSDADALATARLFHSVAKVLQSSSAGSNDDDLEGIYGNARSAVAGSGSSAAAEVLCGPLAAQLPTEWLNAVLARLQALLPAMQPAEHAMVLDACARLDLLPPAVFTAAWLSASGAKLPVYDARSLTSVLHSLAALQLPPPGGWWAGAMTAATATLPHCSPRELSNMLQVRNNEFLHSF